MGDVRSALQDVERQRKQVHAARQAWMDRAAATSDRFTRDSDAYRRDLNEALLAGREPPPPPDPEEYKTPGSLWTFEEEFRRLDAVENALLAEHADELRAQLDRRAERVWQRVAPLQRALEEAAEALEEIRQEHRRLDVATDTVASVWRMQPVTASMLLDSSAAFDEPAHPHVIQSVAEPRQDHVESRVSIDMSGVTAK